MTTAKIFGGGLAAGQQNIAVLGSSAGGGINYSLDPNVLQNANWLNGLTTADRIQSPAPANVNNYNAAQPYVANDYAKDPATNTVYISLRGDITTPNLGNPLTDATWWKVVGNKFFVFQEMINSVGYVLSTLISEIQKAGLQDWISTTTYYQYAVVKEPNTTKIYYSKVANNLGNPLNDTNSWEFINNLANLQDLNLKYAPIISAALQGTPTAPTPPTGDNSTKIATTQFVNQSLQLNPTDLGAIKMYKYLSSDFVPTIKTFSNGAKAYLFNGQTLTQAQAPVLFADRGWGASVVLENRDGRVSISVGSTYEIGTLGGSATHTLTISEMPSHSHSVNVRQGSFEDLGADIRRTDIAGPTSVNTGSILSAGGDQPHNIMQPYVVDAHYLIAW